MDEKKIARINELYHKSKAEEYVEAFKQSLRSQLNNISIQEADGSITDLGKKFGNKNGNQRAN